MYLIWYFDYLLLYFIDYNCINILITKIYVISISSPDTIRAIKYNNNTCYLRAVYKPIVLRRDSSVSIKRVTSPGTGSRSSVYMRETVPFFRETDYSAVKRTIPRWDVDKYRWLGEKIVGWQKCSIKIRYQITKDWQQERRTRMVKESSWLFYTSGHTKAFGWGPIKFCVKKKIVRTSGVSYMCANATGPRPVGPWGAHYWSMFLKKKRNKYS